jgi:hypothetical protein
MEQRGREAWRQRWWWLVLLAVLNLLGSGALAQIRYSVLEEMDEGTVVGNIAKDLGLDKSTLNSRGYRIVVGTNQWRLVDFKVREEGLRAWLPLACLHCWCMVA